MPPKTIRKSPHSAVNAAKKPNMPPGAFAMATGNSFFS